jgi:hypothetical protein
VWPICSPKTFEPDVGASPEPLTRTFFFKPLSGVREIYPFSSVKASSGKRDVSTIVEIMRIYALELETWERGSLHCQLLLNK